MKEIKVKSITIRIPEQLHTDAKVICVKKKIPLGEILISYIEQFVQENKRLTEEK